MVSGRVAIPQTRRRNFGLQSADKARVLGVPFGEFLLSTVSLLPGPRIATALKDGELLLVCIFWRRAQVYVPVLAVLLEFYRVSAGRLSVFGSSCDERRQ